MSKIIVGVADTMPGDGTYMGHDLDPGTRFVFDVRARNETDADIDIWLDGLCVSDIGRDPATVFPSVTKRLAIAERMAEALEEWCINHEGRAGQYEDHEAGHECDWCELPRKSRAALEDWDEAQGG